MKTVRIREDNGKYLVYFTDIKKLIAVNEVGAKIIDLLFNQSTNINLIMSQISDEYNVSTKEIFEDINEFINQIKIEISPETYNDVEQDQLARPLGVELEITKKCNLHCRHCFQKYHSNNEMTFEMIASIIKTINDNDVFEVAIIGGEPMKHHRVLDILMLCEESDLAYSLVTNATLLTNKSINAFKKLTRLSVMVSLDGVGRIHDAIRGKGVFKKVDYALRKLKDSSIETEVLCTLNAENINRFREVADYCRELGISCSFNLFKPFWPEQNKLIPKPKIFFETVIELLRMRQQENYDVGISNAAIVGNLLEMTPRNECRATRSGFAINVNGQIITCPLLETADYYEQGKLPMFDDRFIDTWQKHPTFIAFRNGNLRECQARALIFSGDVSGIDPYGVSEFQKFRSNL